MSAAMCPLTAEVLRTKPAAAKRLLMVFGNGERSGAEDDCMDVVAEVVVHRHVIERCASEACSLEHQVVKNEQVALFATLEDARLFAAADDLFAACAVALTSDLSSPEERDNVRNLMRAAIRKTGVAV